MPRLEYDLDQILKGLYVTWCFHHLCEIINDKCNCNGSKPIIIQSK